MKSTKVEISHEPPSMMIGGSLPVSICVWIGVGDGLGVGLVLLSLMFPPLGQAERAATAGTATSAVAIVLANRRRVCLVVGSEGLDMGVKFPFCQLGQGWYNVV